jgi:beta-glucanase (GH16 family)
MPLAQNTVIFSDNFTQSNGSPVSSANWTPNIGAGSYYGNTQQRPTLPLVQNGHAVLELDTYNPSGPGNSYYGSEMISTQQFDVNTQGALIFQATLRYEQTQKGMIGGFFTLGQGAPSTTGHDELDIELMSKFNTQWQANFYHQAPYDSGTAIQYSPPGFTQQVDHVYRMEWMPNGVVNWYVDGVLYRTITNSTPVGPGSGGLPGGPGTPDQPEFLHFNIWVGGPGWSVSDPSMPAPTANQGSNQAFFLDVSQVSVSTAATMRGTAAADALLGTAAGEYIDASAGNDTITGGAGDDVIEGGAGTNTAVFSAAARNYEISATGGVQAVTVRDRLAADGVDTLTNIQRVTFADQTIDTASVLKAANLGLSAFLPVIDLYGAYLNRAPDALGLSFWSAKLSEGTSLADIGKAFYASAEATALRPAGQTSSALVSDAYTNLLGRSADSAGLNYWTNELQSGRLTPETFGTAFTQAIKSGGGSAADLAALTNKENMGVYYAITQGLTDAAHARTVFAGVSDLLTSNTLSNVYAAAAASTSAELVVKLVGVNVEQFPTV